MIFSGKLSDIFKLGVRSRVPSSELFQFWNGLVGEPKQGITQSRSKFGFTWREARFHDSQHKKKRVVKHTRWKKFRFERKLWTLSLLTGMNRLQEKRNVSLISVCMGSIAIERGRSVTPPWPRQPGRISWFSLGKRTLWRQKSNHIFCW